jgi:hypothetical protein
MIRHRFALFALMSFSLAAPSAAQEARRDTLSDVEMRARQARRGAGLTVGSWDLRGVEPPSTVEVSTMPMISGWFRKGLDRHLALENGIGVWRRVQTTPPTGGIGGSPGEEVQSWVVAQTTAVRLFPFTGPEARFEPFVIGGAGVTLGIDDRETSGGGVLGGATGSSGVAIVPGFSLQGGLGTELRLGDAFGLTVGGRYQWTRFLQDFGGERTYQGPVLEAGFTYRFQYD